MRLECASPARPNRRAAFTLIELLVVMAILATLATLAISAVFTLRESQMKNFTETTVSKLASALDQQWKAAVDQINDEIASPPASNALWNWSLVTAGGDPRRARVIYTKARLKQEFPVTFYQAVYPFANYQGQIVIPAVALQPKSTYKNALAAAGVSLPAPVAPPATASVALPADYESSALLFLALTQGRRGMAAFNPDEHISPTSVQTRGNLKVFVDSWGNPLRYYSFPYYNAELTGTDAQDPENTLLASTWPAAQKSQFTGTSTIPTAIHPLDAGTPRMLIPVIASAGRDGDFGDAPVPPASNTTDNFLGKIYMKFVTSGANDNIYSYRLRKFGARGD
jgi:prepilin-type N-terminal cleavage/methylation domain-containing protein